MAKLAPRAQSWEDEAYAFRQYLQAGVLVAPERVYHMPEGQKGWMRMSFAVDNKLLAEAIARIESIFQRLNPEKQVDDPDRIAS